MGRSSGSSPSSRPSRSSGATALFRRNVWQTSRSAAACPAPARSVGVLTVDQPRRGYVHVVSSIQASRGRWLDATLSLVRSRRGGWTTRLTAGALLVATACAAVPDLHYVADDPDGSTSAASSFRDAGAGGDGGAGSLGDAGSSIGGGAGGTVSCPSSPPSSGVCCGDQPCINCTTANCSDCSAARCAAGAVCCATKTGNGQGNNSVRVECRTSC